ncbi:hypothetical protein HF086_015386 [Spodoptera exigua]|uniref:Uncharacterized protein n=1 Tax=Spodoptera exigua TaxID=7107 RepID=A0A922M078_SPOEX|nr:hypothetical protein HF086_015386 [Spodoptera exigua]
MVCKIKLLTIIVIVYYMVQPTFSLIISRNNYLKIKVNKCCPLNKSVGNGMKCNVSDKTPSFFDTPVYINEKLKKSEKSLEDVFDLVPNKLREKILVVKLLEPVCLVTKDICVWTEHFLWKHLTDIRDGSKYPQANTV